MAKPKRKLKLGGSKSNLIVRNAGYIMPFPVKVAYENFSDFSRHSEWDPNIESSEYVDDACLAKVRWTRKTDMGFTISWKTETKVREVNKSLVWKSIEGVKLENRVIFQPVDDGRGTLMIMSTSYKVPEKIFLPCKKMVGKHQKGLRASHHAAESERIMKVLQNFSKAIQKELEEQQQAEAKDAMHFM